MGESPQLPNTRYGVAIAARGAAPPAARSERDKTTFDADEGRSRERQADKEKFVDLNDYDCPKQDCLSRSEC